MLVERNHSQWNRLYHRNDPDEVDKVLFEINSTPCRTKENKTPHELFYNNPRYQHESKPVYIPETAIVNEIRKRVKAMKTVPPKVPDIQSIESVYVKDFNQKKPNLYKKLKGKAENLIAEISADSVVLFNGNRGYRKISRRDCRLIPKIK